jgi:hypothetical protein
LPHSLQLSVELRQLLFVAFTDVRKDLLVHWVCWQWNMGASRARLVRVALVAATPPFPLMSHTLPRSARVRARARTGNAQFAGVVRARE